MDSTSHWSERWEYELDMAAQDRIAYRRDLFPSHLSFLQPRERRLGGLSPIPWHKQWWQKAWTRQEVRCKLSTIEFASAYWTSLWLWNHSLSTWYGFLFLPILTTAITNVARVSEQFPACGVRCTEGDVILGRREKPMCPANLKRHPWHLLLSHSTKATGDFRTVRLLVPSS